jgi:hypothetical protein
LCGGKRVDDYVIANPDTDKPFTDIKRSYHTACRMAGIEGLWWHDLRATFCTRLALAGYEALTIMTLMGHKDLKTTMRYIRAVQLQRNVSSRNFGHKSPTQAIRPPAFAAVLLIYWSGREDSNLRPLGPKPSALPGCATPRKDECNTFAGWQGIL